MVLGLHVSLAFDLGWAVFSRAYLAVDFFFMLSGFVMARTYERSDGFRHSAGRFLLVRFRRLWPAMAVGTIVGLVWRAGLPAPILAVLLVPALFLLPNPVTQGTSFGAYPLNAPAWSIFSELVANLLHGTVLHKCSTRTLLAIAGVSALGLAMVSPGLDFTHAEMMWKPVVRAVAPYCIGIALWRVNRDTARGPAWLSLLALPASMAAMIVCPAQADYVFLAACPLMIVSALGLPTTRAARWLGLLSFPLYAVHSPTLFLVKGFGGGPAVAAAAAVMLAGIVAIFIENGGVGRVRLQRAGQGRAD